MPITTLKRCQSDPEWWFTVEDCNKVEEDPGTGLCVKYYDSFNRGGKIQLSIGIEDALLLRDAINQLYPPEKFPSK
jgi:hypothetical protein